MNRKSPVTYIILTLPVVLWAALEVYPSYDDWSTLSSPNHDKEWLKFFLPYGSIWRPFDALFGYITGMWPQLFPSLNHTCIVAGHTLSALLLYDITRRLRLSTISQFTGTMFFWLSPCVLGTVLSCDALNQTYSHLWGMGAVWCFLVIHGKTKYAAWAICVILAALAKDNGIAWAVVPPIVAFAFGLADRHALLRGLIFGCIVAVIYGCVRMALPMTYIYNPDYSTFILTKKIKEIVIWLAYTWFAADYVSIVHAPSRNIALALVTSGLSLPFIYVLFIKNAKNILSRQFSGITACIFITMSPHLLISLSVMNTYAGLGMAALLVAVAAGQAYSNNGKSLLAAFAMYMAAAVITDVHHTYKAVTTAAVGRDMAREVIKATGRKVKSAYCVVVDDDEKKFSSFCVLPQDAFGAQAASVIHENRYRWPELVRDTIIPRKQKAEAETIARKALDTNMYECAWIIDKKQVRVINKQ